MKSDRDGPSSAGARNWRKRLVGACTWPIRWFFAPDIFVSYSRRDATSYAEELVSHLSAAPDRFSVAIDLVASLPGRTTPASVLRAARWSRSRVVLCTSAALASTEMQKELAEFSHYPAPVVLVVEPGADVKQAVWQVHVVGVPEVREATGRAAFEASRPSDAVLEGIRKVSRFMRRERRIAIAATLGLLISISAAATGLYFGWQATIAGRVSQATTMALEAVDLLLVAPSRIRETADLAQRSVALAPTSGGDAVLRRALAIVPPLLADLHTGCSGEHAAYDSASGVLVVVGSDKLCVVDVTRRQALPVLPLGELGFIQWASFLSDGTFMLVHRRYGARASTMHLWLPQQQWERVAQFALQADVVAASLAPGRNHIAIASDEGRVGLIERKADGRWQPGRWVNKAEVHTNISTLNFDRQGDHLVVGSRTAVEVIAQPLGQEPRRVAIVLIGKDDLPFMANTPLLFDQDRNRVIVAFAGTVRSLQFPTLTETQRVLLSGVDSMQSGPGGQVVAHTVDLAFTSFTTAPNGRLVKARGRERSKDSLAVSGAITTIGDGTHYWSLGSQAGGTGSYASLRRTASGEEVARIAHETYIHHVFAAGEGSAVVSVSGDDTVRIWGDVLSQNGHTWHAGNELALAAVSPDVRRVAAAVTPIFLAAPRRVEVWDLDPSAIRGRLSLPEGIRSMRLRAGADGLDFVTASGWWRAAGWPSAEATLQQPLAPAPAAPRQCSEDAIAWGADDRGPIIAIARGELSIAEQGKWRSLQIEGVAACAKALAVDASGRHVAVSLNPPGSGAEVIVFRLNGEKPVFRVQTPYLVESMAFDRDGRRLVIGTARKPASAFVVGLSEVQVFDVDAGRQLAAAVLSGQGATSVVCMSPDGRQIAAESDSIARVWELDSAAGTLTSVTSQALTETARACRFSEDGKRLAFADQHGVRVLRLDRQEMLAEMRRRVAVRAITPR